MTYSYTEYGVIVDRTSAGLGYRFAESYRDLGQAIEAAEGAPGKYMFPAVVKSRFVTMTDWQPLTPERDVTTS